MVNTKGSPEETRRTIYDSYGAPVVIYGGTRPLSHETLHLLQTKIENYKITWTGLTSPLDTYLQQGRITIKKISVASLTGVERIDTAVMGVGPTQLDYFPNVPDSEASPQIIHTN